MRVVIPLVMPANASGIIRREGGIPRRLQMLSVTGMKIATTPVVLITEPMIATDTMRVITSDVSDFFERFKIQSPTAEETPVFARPALITNIRAIIIILLSENAASASYGSTIPEITRIMKAQAATASMRGRPIMKAAIHKSRSNNTKIS